MTDCVPCRRSDPGVELPVQRPELVPDLLLGPARDLPPDPLAVGGEAERDGAHMPVLGCVEVDRVFAVTSALDVGLRHMKEPNRLAPRLAPWRSYGCPDRSSDLRPEQDSNLRPTA